MVKSIFEGFASPDDPVYKEGWTVFIPGLLHGDVRAYRPRCHGLGLPRNCSCDSGGRRWADIQNVDVARYPKLKPVLETVLPLSDARRAHELNETGHARGKIVLKVA
ncbi:MAG: hypothetical protein DME36_00530 [Verrucomicrobia bacterium]|nr:MAG: hypothetical protein DME36_00530 [Verrucomicrobiota bacterium]